MASSSYQLPVVNSTKRQPSHGYPLKHLGLHHKLKAITTQATQELKIVDNIIIKTQSSTPLIHS